MAAEDQAAPYPWPAASLDGVPAFCTLKVTKSLVVSFEVAGGGWGGFVSIAAGPPRACWILVSGAHGPEATHGGRQAVSPTSQSRAWEARQEKS